MPSFFARATMELPPCRCDRAYHLFGSSVSGSERLSVFFVGPAYVGGYKRRG